MIVAITGGSGFIGRKLVERHVAEGDVVHLLTRHLVRNDASPETSSIVSFQGDLTDESSDLAPFLENVEVLYHCAGEIFDESRMHALHVTGTKRLIKAAQNKINRWVQLSSVGAYGLCYQGLVTEETSLRPKGIYEETKTESDRLIIAAAKNGAFEYSMLRPTTVYGPERIGRVLSDMIALINKGLFVYVGPPGASVTIVFIDNVVEALFQCGSSPNAIGHVYNIADWRTMEDVVSVIAESLGKAAPTRRLPEKPLRLAAKMFGVIPRMPLNEARLNAMVKTVRYSTERIENELNYSHPVPMEEGLKRTVKAWQTVNLR